MTYTSRINWYQAAIRKYNSLTTRKSSRNIMLYRDGKLVAIFNTDTNQGNIL